MSKSRKKGASKKARPAPRKPRPTTDASAIAVMDPAKFDAAPRKRRSSKLDAVAKKLIEVGKGSVVALPIPEGRDAGQFRSYTYSQLKKSMDYFTEGKGAPVNIRVSADGKSLGISLR